MTEVTETEIPDNTPPSGRRIPAPYNIQWGGRSGGLQGVRCRGAAPGLGEQQTAGLPYS